MITVVVCTYNRAAVLEKTLDSLLTQSLAPSLFDIVVIDDGSTDQTKAVVLHFQKKKLPRVSYIRKDKNTGLAHSRNMVMKRCKNPYIAFIDDDALANPDWLKKALEFFTTVTPVPWGVTGPVLPYYPSAKPDWYKDIYESDVKGKNERFLTKGETFTGANMFFRVEKILGCGGFNESVDMRGDELVLGEETSLFENLWKVYGNTAALYYSPKLSVDHMIHPYKLTVSYKLKRSFAAGQSHYFRRIRGSLPEKIFYTCMVTAYLPVLALFAFFSFFTYRYWQNWAVERIGPFSFAAGFYYSLFGVKKIMRNNKRV